MNDTYRRLEQQPREPFAIRSRLRSSTRDLHDALDQHAALRALTSDQNPGPIQDSMVALVRALAPVESTVLESGWSQSFALGWFEPSLAERLRVDAGMEQSGDHRLGHADSAVDFTGPDQWLGAAWVLAGSRHGAAALAAGLQKRLQRPLVYFAPWTAADRSLWTALLTSLNERVANQNDRAVALADGARRTFTAILEGLP